MTWAAFSFPLIVVATDLTVRLINKHNARAVINTAFIPAMLCSIAVIHGTGTPTDIALRIGAASGCAYLSSNLLDVLVFQKIRDRISAWWPAPLCSTIIASYIDTFSFFSVAFWHTTDPKMQDWPRMAFNQASTKIAVSLLIVMPLYKVLLDFLGQKLGRSLIGKTIV